MNTISVKDTCFIDNYGRERIFNGFNCVYKGIAKDKDGVIRYRCELNDEILLSLKERGINMLRLGLTWAAIEPEMGKYNLEYLDGYKEILKLCEKHEIYCFIDWHQDLYSPFGIDCGDGCPKWACTSTSKPRQPKVIWAEGYFFDKSVQESFDAFWDNKDVAGRGLIDRFCDMLTFVADYFKDCKCVMGYDVFNEPYPGTPGKDIFWTLTKQGLKTVLFDSRVDRKKLIRDAKNNDVMKLLEVIDDKGVYHTVIDTANELLYKFDTEKYYPFLKKAAEAIRKVDKTGIIFAENNYYSNIGIPTSTPRIVYDDGTVEQNFAFAPHGYDVTVDSPLTNKASSTRVDFIFDEHKRTQERLGCPVLVGEWGGMVPGDTEYPALEHLIDKFDANKWSQTYWHFFNSFKEEKIMDILSRPVPQAVAGHINYYHYDRELKEFSLSYTGDGSTKAPTLIYVPGTPKAIYSTRKYTLKEDGILQVSAGKGECIVKVEY